MVVLLEYIYLLQHHKNISISGGGCRFGMSGCEIVRMIIDIVLLCSSWRIVFIFVCVFVCVCVYFAGGRVISSECSR